MARLQILELPEGDGDERPPFLLVIDGWTSGEYVPHVNVIQQTGARGVLVFEETVDIPANEVPVDPDGYPLKLRLEPDFETFHEQVQEEILAAQGKAARALNGLRLAQERSEIARDADRLAKWKNELTDALGMDRARDWDDIRNAAAALRKAHDARGDTIERVLALPDHPELMDAQHEQPQGYLHGYRVAISDAKRTVRQTGTECPPT